MDEMFEILTWKQLLLHDKPVVIFNYQGYWDPLIALMHNIIEQRFAKAEVATYFHVVDNLEAILDVIGF
jgi:predicted Rossmann-fold nucleotide-binding protein